MCKRFTPLSHNEAQDILDAFTEGKPIRLPDKDINDAKHDVFPGKTSPVFLSDSKGGLVLVEATWGFPAADGKKLIFNTRLDTALRHLVSGEGMWSKAIEQGRCLVPTRAFYENRKADKRYSERSDKERSDKRQWTSRNRQVSLISSSRASLSSSNIGFRLMVQRRSSWREFFRTDGFQ